MFRSHFILAWAQTYQSHVIINMTQQYYRTTRESKKFRTSKEDSKENNKVDSNKDLQYSQESESVDP